MAVQAITEGQKSKIGIISTFMTIFENPALWLVENFQFFFSIYFHFII